MIKCVVILIFGGGFNMVLLVKDMIGDYFCCLVLVVFNVLNVGGL